MGRFSVPKEDAGYKLSTESAEAAVRELITYYNVDVDAIPDGDIKNAVEMALAKMVNYYRLGLLENIRNPQNVMTVKQHLQDPPGEVREIVYTKMGGKAKRTADGIDLGETFRRTCAVMAFLSGQAADFLENLKGSDCSAMETLYLVFQMG
jgi:hypothetical protein